MKKTQVIWTDESLLDLEIIYDFLADKSDKVAKKVVQSILTRTRQLETFPESGKQQSFNKKVKRPYRYLVDGHYKIFYSQDEKALYIEAIIDTRQDPESYRTNIKF